MLFRSRGRLTGPAPLLLRAFGGIHEDRGGGRAHEEHRRDLRACLRETEDVVYEEQHVLALITEVLGRREAREVYKAKVRQ